MIVRADIRLEDAPMVPVDCRRCGAEVRARKSSWNRTSVQWTRYAVSRCEERWVSDRLADYGGRELFLECAALSGSIAAAVAAGAMPVIDADAQ